MSDDQVNGQEEVKEYAPVTQEAHGADNVTPMPKAPPADGQIPQQAMLNLQDLQNIRALMDRVDLKGVSEANVLVTICAKIDTILRAEAMAKKAADEKAVAEGKK